MTLENSKRLLKHYEDTNQTARAEEMKKRVAFHERRLALIKHMEKPKDGKKSA